MPAQEASTGRHEEMPPSANRGIAVEGLSHWYGGEGRGIHALDNISTEFSFGDFICVVGPSGCGKTTWLRIFAGFEEPSEGRIVIGDHAVDSPNPERGVVFQTPNLFPWLSVEKNVSFGPRMGGQSSQLYKDPVAQSLEMVGLSEFVHSRPYELSGGMQQRVAIARVLVNDPSIMLMDEPFGALDALTRERMQEELLNIWRQTRKTVFFITHSVEEAVYLGTRVIVMGPRPGRIVLDRQVSFAEREDGTVVGRELRAAPEFVRVREEIAEAIYKAAYR